MHRDSSVSRFRPGFISSVVFFACLLFLVCIGPGSTRGLAAQVTLAWNASTSSSVAGYKLYYGYASRTYGTPVDVGNVTQYTLTGIQEGVNCYFAVTAYDASRNESAFSTELACFTLVPAACTNGAISPSAAVVASLGTNQTFAITPAANYKISAVTVDGASVGAVASYTFSNVAGSHSISASFAAAAGSTYTISASAGANGAISPSGSTSVSQGGSQSYTITPAANYKISAVTVDGASVGAVASYTFSNVAANHSISASFAAAAGSTYAISASAGANGAISPSGSTSVIQGGSQSYTITPAAKYKISAVTVDGASVGAVAGYTFSNVTASHSISASFASAESASLLELNFEEGHGSTALDSTGSGNNGAVSGAAYTTDSAVGSYALSFDGSDYVSVPATASLTPSDLSVSIWIKPAADTSSTYEGILQGANGDGETRGFGVYDYQNKPAGVINFGDASGESVLGNSLVQGQWTHLVMTYDHQAIRLYQNGSLVNTVSETRNINWDATASNLTIGLAHQLYFSGMIDKVKLYNYAISSQDVAQLYAEKNAVPVPVKTYTLTAAAGANGAISPSGSTPVNSGASQTFTITPNAGYQVQSVLVDGTSVGAVSSYTFSNVTAAHSISASFAAAASSTYAISASAGSGGSISPSGTVQVKRSASQAYKISPSRYYAVSDVRVDGTSVGAVTSYTFTNVQGNHTISATFSSTRTGRGISAWNAFSSRFATASSGSLQSSGLLEQSDAVPSYLLAGSGFFPGSGGSIAVMTPQGAEAAQPVHIDWPAYNNLNGEIRVAAGNIDGSGQEKIVAGLGPVAGASGIPGGYFAVLDADSAVLAWGQVQWPEYNAINGETRPACGDIDGDGIDEIVIGLGPGGEGRLEVFKLVGNQLTHVKWLQTGWQDYNNGNGETRPACGDLDGDGTDELIVGLGPVPGNPDVPGGVFVIFDRTSAGSAELRDSGISDVSGWGQVQWPDYNRSNGEIWPACGDVNGDGRDEIVLGLGKEGQGRFEVVGFDLLQNRMQHIAWQQSHAPAGTEIRPACGPLDQGSGDGIVIGYSREGLGILEVFGGGAQNFPWLRQVQTQHEVSRNQDGGIWPAVFRLGNQ